MKNIITLIIILFLGNSSFAQKWSNIQDFCEGTAVCATQSPFLDSLAVALGSSPVTDSLASQIVNNPDICSAQLDCLASAFDATNQPNAFIDSLNNYLSNIFSSNPDICGDIGDCVSSLFDPTNQPNSFIDSLTNFVANNSSGDPCSGPPRSYFHTIEVAAAGPLTTGQQDASILATTVAGGGSLTHGNYTIVSVTQNCEVGNATTQLYANGAAILPTFGNGVTAISASGGPGENIFLRTTAANGASHCWYSIGILSEIPPCP